MPLMMHSLSTCVATLGNNSLTHAPESPCCLKDHGDGSQPPRVAQLALHGRMMGNVLRVLSRHLWGFLVINTLVLSGVVFVAAILAFLMKLPFSRGYFLYVAELGFQSDLSVPFFPAFLALMVWLGCQIAARIAKRAGRPLPALTKYSYLLLLLTLTLGLATLFAIGDIGLDSLTRRLDLSPRVERHVNTAAAWVGAMLTGLFATSVLPYFMPKRLLESGASQRGSLRLLFTVAGHAVVFGIPLFAFFLLAQEDLSNETVRRVRNGEPLDRSHFSRLDHFIPVLETQSMSGSEARRGVAAKLLAGFNDAAPFAGGDSPPERHDEVEGLLAEIEAKNEHNLKTAFYSRWAQAAAHVVTRDDLGEYGLRLQGRKNEWDLRKKLTCRFNEQCLSDPELFVGLVDRPQKPLWPRSFRIVLESELDADGRGPSAAASAGNADQDFLASLGLIQLETTNAEKDRLIGALGQLRASGQVFNRLYPNATPPKKGNDTEASKNGGAIPEMRDKQIRSRILAKLRENNQLSADSEDRERLLAVESVLQQDFEEFSELFEPDEEKEDGAAPVSPLPWTEQELEQFQKTEQETNQTPCQAHADGELDFAQRAVPGFHPPLGCDLQLRRL